MSKVFTNLKSYKKECIIGPGFKLLEACFELFIPLIVADIVDKGIKNQDIPYILTMCGILVLLGIISLACSLTAQHFAAKAATGFGAKLRHSFLSHLQSFSYKEIDSLGTSTMVTRMNADINQIQTGVNLVIRLLLRSPFVVVGAMFMAFTIDFNSGLIFLIMIVTLSLIVFGIMAYNIPLYRKAQKELDGVTAISRENLGGVRVIRAFCQEENELEKFQAQTERLNKIQNFVAKISTVLNPVTFIVVNFSVVTLLWTGAINVESGSLTQGQVLALYNYMSQILVELIKTADLIVVMTKSAASVGRVQDVFDTKSSQKDGEKVLSSIENIEFKNVSFKYNKGGDEAISKINFHAKKGDIVGIVGGTGSGKTTLVNLIPRLYDTSEGEILVNGIDIKNYTHNSLKDKIGIVPQKAVLFSGTIRENIKWGKKDADDDDIYSALEIAQAKEIVDSKNGLDTLVSQSGKNFSGGQKQRLSIARAIVKKPDVLILDDSSSALDYITDKKLRQSVASLENPPLTFIVSQRASSVKNANLIVVMEDGEVVGMGVHETLYQTCEVYKEIYLSQYKEEGATT